jgi:hypothetical protein
MHEAEADKHQKEADKLKLSAKRAKDNFETLKNLEGEINPKSEDKLKSVTQVAEKAMLAAESKVNQLESKSTEAKNDAL